MAREFIAERRKALGLSQKSLGTLVGVNAVAISRLEKGYCDLPLKLAAQLTRVLGIPIGEVPVSATRPPTHAAAPTALDHRPAPQPTSEIEKREISVPTAPTISDLSNPKTFNQLPNRTLLERPITPELRIELARELQYAERVLQTSGVTAPVWREWRTFEKVVRETLRGEITGARVEATTSLTVSASTRATYASPSHHLKSNGENPNAKSPDPRLGNLTLPPQGNLDNIQWRTVLSAEIDRLRQLKHQIRFSKSDFASMRSYWKELHAALSELDAREGITSHSGEAQRSGYNALFFKHAEALAPGDWFTRCKMEAAGLGASDTSKGFLRHFRVRCEQHLSQSTLDEINSAVLRSRGRISEDSIVRYVPISTPAPVFS